MERREGYQHIATFNTSHEMADAFATLKPGAFLTYFECAHGYTLDRIAFIIGGTTRNLQERALRIGTPAGQPIYKETTKHPHQDIPLGYGTGLLAQKRGERTTAYRLYKRRKKEIAI